MPSRALEDYLKIIYKLSEPAPGEDAKAFDDAWVQTSTIAERMQLSQASVSKMLKKLAEKALIEHKPYHGVRLTQAGREVALGLIRKHRILEAYLVEKLNYDWDEVDAEAEVLEHSISDKLAHQMWLALGKPTHDPHGSPIPTEDFELPDEPWRALSTVEEGSEVTVQRILNGQPEALRYLQSLGVTMGQRLKVLEKAPLSGPLTIEVKGSGESGLDLTATPNVLDRALAASVFVDVIDATEESA